MDEAQKAAVAKQAAEQPLSPTPPNFIADVIREQKEAENVPSEFTDKAIAEFAQSDAWKLLKKYIRDKQERLGNMTAEAVRKEGFNLQEIGFRYLIFDQVKAALEDVIHRVEAPSKIKLMQANDEEGDNKDL